MGILLIRLTQSSTKELRSNARIADSIDRRFVFLAEGSPV